MKEKQNKTKKVKKPWPTKAAMTQVYENKLWGGNDVSFYSGKGSHDPNIVKPYLAVLSKFFNSFERPLTVCDLGCRDFNVGKELFAYTEKYLAVDIVEPLVKHNKETFKSKNLEFYCLDIAKDNLPPGDCALVRQVLQHLSNKEVQAILNKLTNFKYVIITEHVPEGYFEPNKDIISGQGTRLKKQSGLNILEPPFHFKVKDKKQLLSVALGDFKGGIETSLYTLF